MKKKIVITGITLTMLIIMHLTPGCIMIGYHDNFEYVLAGEKSKGTFIPDLNIRDNTQHIPFLLFRIDIDRLPHSFVMRHRDHSYEEKHKDFNSFVVEKLYIQFEDGTRIDCIDPSLPQEERIFEISLRYEEVFEGIITKRMDFTVHIAGMSIKKDGTVVPFRNTARYKYKGKKATLFTIVHEIVSC